MSKDTAMALLKAADTLVDLAGEMNETEHVEELCKNKDDALKVVQSMNEAVDSLTVMLGHVKLDILSKVAANDGKVSSPTETIG